MPHHLRLARPVTDPGRSSAMYIEALEFEIVGQFEDHAGFDGIMLALPGADYHFEFTRCRDNPVKPHHTEEDLVVFYLSEESEWEVRCTAMLCAGFQRTSTLNPYWNMHGATFRDLDGYLTVLHRGPWRPSPRLEKGPSDPKG